MMVIIRKWLEDAAGTAIAEFALIFPLMMTMLLGVFELGNAIAVNQRTIAASQIVADLIARNITVDDAMIDEAIRAAELAIAPYETTDFGIDIISVQYDENDEPQEVWRETRNMVGSEADADRAIGLGVEGDGALVVITQYIYRPFFGGMVIDEFTMREAAFARGRRTAVVGRE